MSEYLELPWSMEDTVENLKEVKKALILNSIIENLHGKGRTYAKEIEFDFDRAIKALEEQEKHRWIPITYHVVTDEERKEDCILEGIVYMFDCHMPDDNEEILVCHKNGWVDKDTCFIDEGYSLDSGWDWIEDVVAWMPLPEPYKE